MIRILVLIFCLVTSNVYAGIVTMPQYGPNGTVTDVNLNDKFNRLTNTLNGDIDNNNTAVDFEIIEVLDTLPAPGRQGRVVFDTSVNTLFFDTGTSFIGVGVLPNNQTWTGSNTFTGDNIFQGTDTFASTVTAFADINGGTMDEVNVDGATATGMLYTNDASDNLSQLGSQGTPGQALISAGAGVNPTFSDQSFKLLSVTTTSGNINTGDIVIEPSKQYYVTVSAETASNTAANLFLRFNSDSTSTAYAYSAESILMNTSPTVTTVGDDSNGSILITAVAIDTSGNGGWARFEFYIETYKIGTAVSATVRGTNVVKDSSSAFQGGEFSGILQKDLTITDFELFGDASTFNWVVRVYELIQS